MASATTLWLLCPVLFLQTILVDGACSGSTYWVTVAEEAVGAGGTEEFRFLDFYDQVYAQYSVDQIVSYKFEWGANYEDSIEFELATGHESHEFLANTADSVNQNHLINVLSSTVSGIPVSDGSTSQYFCKACSSSSSAKYGDTCWGILNGDTARQCGCNSGGWNGNGVYYGGYPSGQCNVCACWNGAFAGYKSSGQAKGGISSLGLRISVQVCNPCVDEDCNDDNVCNGVEFCNDNGECESPDDFGDCSLNFVCDATFGCVRDCDSFAIDGYLQDCSAEFDTIKTDGAALFEAIEDANAGISSLGEDLTTLQDDVTSVTERVSTLETGLEATNGDVADLQSDVTAVSDRATDLESGLADTNAAVSTLESDLSDLSSSVDAISTNVEAIFTELSSLGDRLTALEEFISSFGPNNAHGESSGNQFNSPSEQAQSSAAGDASVFMKNDNGLNHTVINVQWVQIAVVVVALLLLINVVLLARNCCGAAKQGKYQGVVQQYLSDDEQARFRQ